jgi:metal-sulfur cluster biosynthetic enzyme
MKATKKDVEKALSEIVDPHTGIDIVKMGLVEKIEINEQQKRIYVVFRPTSPYCPITRFFDTRIRDLVKGLGYEPEVEIVT